MKIKKKEKVTEKKGRKGSVRKMERNNWRKTR